MRILILNTKSLGSFPWLMQERIPMDPSSLSQSLKPLGLMENMLSSVLTHHIA